eukprot:CAMPEP_0175144144 /NCGR_PEP_ID=MMETSP0087-20121206/13938_1 /TAXON_ID=136419 /ORGANISM="Unknown Unknown, Strain D1" /LENGTH=198 /DNA_ID=CAMNT_0016428519 /DNA_START=134 /DNA_END=730 /DNA_ORIENTATION=+
MGSVDCTACDSAGNAMASAELRDLKPDPKALHLPKADKERFTDVAKILLPRPKIISGEAEDVTERRPVVCPPGTPNCYRAPAPVDCAQFRRLYRRRLLTVKDGKANKGTKGNFEGRFDIPGHPCLQPGQNVGPILRPGGTTDDMIPAPYGLPHYPFAPDVQDWDRPAVLAPRPEGEVSQEAGRQEDRAELRISDRADQ